ncbi:MAG: MFS transporter [Eggerthellaceae bacterium]|nr:MFS transporter [Eggerthellaceae bacterium]
MSNPNEKGGAPTKTPSYAWVILATVYLLSVAAAMFWFSVPPTANAIIPTYIVQLGVENINANFGALMSHLAFGALIAALIASVLQSKIGIKWIMVIAAVCILGGSLIAALSGDSYNMLVASRWVGGFGVGFVAVSATTAVSMWFGDDRRALALAIWATWVPVAMLIVFNLVAPQAIQPDMGPNGPVLNDHGTPVFGNIHFVWWFVVVVAAIAFVLALVAYRNPEGAGGHGGGSLKDGLAFIKNRQVIALMFCMFFYTFVSNCFTTYNVTFMTDAVENGGFGMDSATANLIASVASASGIIAPLFGAIYDKIEYNKKYLMIAAGGLFYLLSCIVGFKAWGMVVFVLYILFMILANAILCATVRSTMPMLVGRGGFVAVSLGMSLMVFLEFFGQVFTNLFGSAVDAFGWATASFVVAVPVAVLLVISGLLIKPSSKPQAQMQ